jgi:acetylornithine deacetylase
MTLQQQLTEDVIDLLKKLITTQSFSKEEEGTALIISEFFAERNVPYSREINNIWARNQHFNKDLPTILLNSHHDTVKPNINWIKNPFEAFEENGKLFGLGSNDAGASLVSLLAAFMYFYYRTDLKYNFVFVASAEEEITGANGLELLIRTNRLRDIDFAIVGEPTDMQMAISEKGLMVIDATTYGKAGHAAREEGENAIYKAMKDIQWLQNDNFEKKSALLGPVKTSVTVINAGAQHNVVPDVCTFTIDIRVNDQYTLEEVLAVLKTNLKSDLKPRSMRLQPSSIPENHLIVMAGLELGKKTYGSPTTSDQAVLICPSLKMGPGHSGRSHTADEFIYLKEIEDGIEDYIKMLKMVCL